jgi:hypothetical protein
MSDDAGVEQDDAGTPLSAADECLVDMADNQALAALFAHPVDARPGTYDHITIYLCVDPSRQGYSSYVKGSMHLSGDTYYTSAGSRVLTTRVEQQGYVRLDYAGCASGVPLPAPLTVVENEDITVNAFFSLKNIAWGMLGSNGIGGCTGAPDQTHTVCAAYPIPVTYVGTTSTRLEQCASKARPKACRSDPSGRSLKKRCGVHSVARTMRPEAAQADSRG